MPAGIKDSTLVILLGASKFPGAEKKFVKSEAFANSKKAVLDYFLDADFFGLPSADSVLDLFDSELTSVEIYALMEDFLSRKVVADNADKSSITDLIIYYVGHGGLGEGNAGYYLAIRATKEYDPYTFSITLRALASLLRKFAAGLRRFLILDSCFAASAVENLMAGGLNDVVSASIRGASFSESIRVDEADRKSPGATRGTSLLCASSKNEPARFGPQLTYFTQALINTLRTGVPSGPRQLSLREVCTRTGEYISQKVPLIDRVQPEVHTPDHSGGRDIADDEIFPNPLAVVLKPPSVAVLKSVGVLRGHTDHVDCVAWSPDGQWLASGSYDNTVRIWNAHTLQWEREFRGHAFGISDIAWSGDNMQIASGSYDKTVRLWNRESGETWRFEGHKEQVRCVAWTSNYNVIASGAVDESVRCWSLTNHKVFRKYRTRAPWVNALAFSPDTNFLAIGVADGNILLRDPRLGDETEQKRKIKAHHSYVNALAWMPGTSQLCSGSGGGTLRIWSVGEEEIEAVGDLVEHTDKILRIKFSSDGKRMVSLGQDCLNLFETSGWNVLATLPGPFPTNTYLPLAISASGTRIATATAASSNLIEIYEIMI